MVAILAQPSGIVQAETVAPRPIVLIPSGPMATDILPDLADMIKKYHGLEVTINPAIELNPDWLIPGSEQFNAKTLTDYGTNLSQLSAQAPFVILITDYDINSADRKDRFLFFLTTGNAMAISLARMQERRSDRGWALERAMKGINRGIGERIYNLPRTKSIESVMYAPIRGLKDLDNMDFWYDKAGPKPQTALAPIKKQRKGSPIISGLIGGLVVTIVPLVLRYMQNQALQKSTMIDGIHWLSYGPVFKVIGIASTLMVVVLTAGITIQGDPDLSWVGILAISTPFFLLFLALLLEGFFVRIGFDQNYLYTKSWVRLPRQISWTNVLSAEYSPSMSWWRITTKQGMVYASTLITGIGDLCQELDNRGLLLTEPAAQAPFL